MLVFRLSVVWVWRTVMFHLHCFYCTSDMGSSEEGLLTPSRRPTESLQSGPYPVVCLPVSPNYPFRHITMDTWSAWVQEFPKFRAFIQTPSTRDLIMRTSTKRTPQFIEAAPCKHQLKNFALCHPPKTPRKEPESPFKGPPNCRNSQVSGLSGPQPAAQVMTLRFSEPPRGSVEV